MKISTTHTRDILGLWTRLLGAMLMVGLILPSIVFSQSPAPVDLGSTTTFAILASSTVTNTGATTVNGDLGVSPGTGLTGSPTVNGMIHLGDSVAAQAQLDLTTAFNDAAGRTVNAITVAGNLGGQTLTPGLYKSTSSLEVSSGDLTLDGLGDPNAVWIFQMASTLVTTSDRQVILSGGAQVSNIFWQVGSSATLGTNSVFKGSILALASITLTTGATLDGRALAQTGSVTLEGNTVTSPLGCLVELTGDVNVSSNVSSADIIYLVNFVFKAGPAPLPCPAAGDVNCSGGAVSSADAIYLVNSVFKAGPPPCDVCTLVPATWTCP